MRRLASLTICGALLLGAAAIAADSEWIRVSHRQFPVSFDLPAEASVQRVGIFSLARPRAREGRLIEVDIFGLRPLPGRLSALQFTFFWITDGYRGVEREDLAELSSRLSDAEVTESFLRKALYQQLDVKLEDGGRSFVDGHLARRMRVRRTVAHGTKDERVIEGAIVLIPVSPSETLCAIARFDERSTAEEQALFPRVVDSLQIGESDQGGSLQAGLAR